MAQLEISEILLDPDFVDPILLIHRKPCVDSFGENQLQETVIQTVGTIQPTSGKTLERLPEALRSTDVSTFWIQGQIIADAKCAYPDLLVFKGSRFAVQMVFDWMNYGNSYCEGICVRERPTL